jgi:hypothetical protein
MKNMVLTDKPIDAGAPGIEVTPAMIEAGVQAYYENTSEDWNSPSGTELRKMMRTIFSAMSAARGRP